MCAYRKRISLYNVNFQTFEEWKEILDENFALNAVLMDLYQPSYPIIQLL